jgi:hypothetical protein
MLNNYPPFLMISLTSYYCSDKWLFICSCVRVLNIVERTWIQTMLYFLKTSILSYVYTPSCNRCNWFFFNYPPFSMHFSHLILLFGQLIILLFLCTCFRYCWTYANRTHAGLFENFCLTAWLRWLYYWSIQIICMWLLTMYLQNWRVHALLSIFSQYKQRTSRQNYK